MSIREKLLMKKIQKLEKRKKKFMEKRKQIENADDDKELGLYFQIKLLIF